MPKERAILDTNVFNHILTKEVEPLSLDSYELLITHAQKQEIEKAKNPKLSALIGMAEQIDATVFLCGYSPLSEARLGGGEVYEKVFKRLQELQKSPSLIKRKNESNIYDAIIVDTAISNGLTLITNDSHLKKIMEELGGRSVDLRVS